jgi:hypothetical protein
MYAWLSHVRDELEVDGMRVAMDAAAAPGARPGMVYG